MRANQGGFTLIELIIVIVILGALAVVAVPRYVDLQTQAEEASAEGVYGAAQAAAAINFAGNLAGASNVPVATGITTGQDLLDAMDGEPDGWQENTATDGICWAGQDGDTTCEAGEYQILITTAEQTDNKATLSLSTL